MLGKVVPERLLSSPSFLKKIMTKYMKKCDLDHGKER
jgi:hypothetical protein